MIGVFDTDAPPPPIIDMRHQWIATEACELVINSERTIKVVAGQHIVFNDAAFDESPQLHSAVMQLVAVGVLMLPGRMVH